MPTAHKHLFLILALLLAAPALEAEICGLDDRPGATLLLPYFEVDLRDPAGATTFFTVHNTSPEPVLARVVLWTDAAYPTLGFEIELTGFDLQAINLRDVFEGRLPKPPSDGETPACAGADVPFEGFLAAAHTGEPTPQLEGLCAGFAHEDGVARGYGTVDVVNGCTALFPSDKGYFGPEGVAGYANVLAGDFFFFDPATRKVEGDLLVSLEAQDGAFGAGDLTYYGRYVDYSGADAREPLPTLWANRFLGGGPFDITSRSIVWRDTGSLPEAFDCSGEPSWFPLDYGEIMSIDEQENALFLSTDIIFVVEPEPPFPAATQEGFGFRGFSFGWEVLDLNPSPSSRLQSYVMEVVEAEGGTGYLRAAAPLDGGCSTAGCAFGETAVARVCIVGKAGDSPPMLAPEEPIEVQAFPGGCFSSSCTLVYRSICELEAAAAALEVEATFCLRDIADDDTVCTADCNGGGFAECTLADGLPAGEYTLRFGELETAFTVPMEIPLDGICAGVDDE